MFSTPLICSSSGGHGFGDHLGVGARILGAHHHRRRHHVRVFRDRQLEDRYQAGDKDDDRQHAAKIGLSMKNREMFIV
jgi:hypothetical protein